MKIPYNPKKIILFILAIGLFICNTLSSSAMTRTNDFEEKKTEDFYKSGMKYMEDGNYIKALPNLLSFIEVTDGKKDIETINKRAEAFLYIASIHYYFNDFSSSVKFNQEALVNAEKANNNDIKVKALCNMFSPLAELGKLNEAKSINKKYYSLMGDSLTPFAYIVNEAYLSFKRDDFNSAKRLYTSAFDTITKYGLGEQYKSFPYSELFKISLKENNPDEAINYLNRYRELISYHPKQIQDYMRKDCYKGLIDAYLAKGNVDSVMAYQNKYVQLMDSSINLDKFMSISSDIRQSAIDNKNKEIDNLNLSLLNHKIIFYSVLSLAFLVILSLSIFIYFKYKIRDRNKILYERNIEVVRAQQENDLKLEDKEFPMDVINSGNPYSEILSKINRIMEDESIYCNPEFSLVELARLIQSNTKYVSQALNEGAGQNFRTFINEYRIRLARKRLSTENEYFNMTISAIAESVGFKSVTSFNQSFQKYVGMTPTTYRKIGKKMRLS